MRRENWTLRCRTSLSESNQYTSHSHHLRWLHLLKLWTSLRDAKLYPNECLSVNEDNRGEYPAVCRGSFRVADVGFGDAPVVPRSFLWSKDERIFTGAQVLFVAEALSTSLTWHPFVCTLQCLLLPSWSGPVASYDTKRNKMYFSTSSSHD